MCLHLLFVTDKVRSLDLLPRQPQPVSGLAAAGGSQGGSVRAAMYEGSEVTGVADARPQPASIRFARSGRHGLIIEPFYRYWKIDQSETQNIYYLGSYTGYGWEPRNNSTEYGLRVQMSL